MTERPHDALFKAAFSDPAAAAAELRSLVGPELARAIDWTTLEPEPGSFVDPELADRHVDILFSARLLGSATPVLIYFLLEHQSTSDPLLPLRIIVYQVRIWERHARNHPGTPLPVIVPLVVSHAQGGWSAPLRFEELFEPEALRIEALRRFVPSSEILLDDLTQMSDEDLRARALATFPRLVLWALRDARSAGQLLEGLRSWAPAFATLAAAPSGRDALLRLLRYIALVTKDLPWHEFHAKLVASVPAASEASMTIAEELYQRGKQEGRQEGRQEGEVVGQRQMLRRLLVLKFGPITPELDRKIEGAQSKLLERWLERTLTVDTAADVFAGA